MKTLTFTPSALPCNWRGNVMALTFAGALGLFAGCASGPESHVVSAPPPATPAAQQASAPLVVTQPANGTAAPATNTIVVTQSPPAAHQEVVTARPSSDHVWVGGYWTWRTDRYEWTPGRWVIPPRSGAVWIPPRWAPEGNGYRFYEGYWD